MNPRPAATPHDAPGQSPEHTEAHAGAPPVPGTPPGELRPSRSARKREALALQKLGVTLTQLKPALLLTLALPEELLEAVLEAQRLRSRPALARQQQYIGRLMRQIDAAPIRQALDAKLAR